MIVTSKRCFLNVVTQFYPKESLLNATYYIADLTGPGGISHLNSRNNTAYMEDSTFLYGEDGQLHKTGPPVSSAALQKYHINYTEGSLNPTSLLTSTKVNMDMNSMTRDPETRFRTALSDTDTHIAVYEDLFRHELRGNGLQFLIYMNDQICCQFAHITCEYLSQCFGADITFIDKLCGRTDVHPQAKAQYPGNKEYAKRFIPWVRDQELLSRFEAALTKSDFSSSVNNLAALLNVCDAAGLLHMYQLIWPNDPLPPGNYTAEHLKEIIISKAMGSRAYSPYDALSNLFSPEDFYDMTEEY